MTNASAWPVRCTASAKQRAQTMKSSLLMMAAMTTRHGKPTPEWGGWSIANIAVGIRIWGVRPSATGLQSQAKGMWLLFIDASTTIPEGFVSRYLAHVGAADVVVGGVAVRDGGNITSLRWRYEHAKMKKNKASERNRHPYKSFRTTNFMVKKSVMLSHSLPMNVAGYGYEDVLWGKALAQDGVSVRHIDNPVYYDELESNTRYLAKTGREHAHLANP